MPQIGNLMVSVYREESKFVGELIAAMCAAQADFLPVSLDCHGSRHGEVYRYASIKSIRRATQAALSAHGLVIHHVYGHNDEGEYVVTVLRHISDQYICSTLKIPPREDAQDHKAVKTLLCRTAIEGLLGIVTEDDDDAQSQSMEVDAQTRSIWATNIGMAKDAISRAESVERVNQLEALARTRIREGQMSPTADQEVAALCNDRRNALTKKEKTSANATRTAGDKVANAAGGGSGSANGSSGRATVAAG